MKFNGFLEEGNVPTPHEGSRSTIQMMAKRFEAEAGITKIPVWLLDAWPDQEEEFLQPVYYVGHGMAIGVGKNSGSAWLFHIAAGYTSKYFRVPTPEEVREIEEEWKAHYLKPLLKWGPVKASNVDESHLRREGVIE